MFEHLVYTSYSFILFIWGLVFNIFEWARNTLLFISINIIISAKTPKFYCFKALVKKNIPIFMVPNNSHFEFLLCLD